MHKSDFPILQRKINGKSLVYLDNAATSQLPSQVLDSLYEFETHHRANVHRGVHTLSEESTELYENSRKIVAKFINAVIPAEVVFTSGTTDSINLVAFSWARKNLKKVEIILVSEVEHHSNLIPWQKVCNEVGCKLEFIPVDDNGMLQIENVNVDWKKVKFVSITHVSNVLGVVNDIKSIVKYIKKKSLHMPKILVDGAQSISHLSINVQKLGVDFFAFSGHKMYGPMGIGVIWINRNVFGEMFVYKTGGGMINNVDLYNSTFLNSPQFLEAGTPNVSGAIGLASACKYLMDIGMDKIRTEELEVMKYALESLSKIKAITVYGSMNYMEKCGVISFNYVGIPSHDLATVLDSEGVAIRSGHHCVMPWHKKQKITTSARISFGLYNSKEDIDKLIIGINKAKKLLT